VNRVHHLFVPWNWDAYVCRAVRFFGTLKNILKIL
jgi:hypothetical protein